MADHELVQPPDKSISRSQKTTYLLLVISGLLIVFGAGIFFVGNARYSQAKSNFRYCSSYDVNDMLNDTATGICVFEQIKVANSLKSASSQMSKGKLFLLLGVGTSLGTVIFRKNQRKKITLSESDLQ